MRFGRFTIIVSGQQAGAGRPVLRVLRNERLVFTAAHRGGTLRCGNRALLFRLPAVVGDGFRYLLVSKFQIIQFACPRPLVAAGVSDGQDGGGELWARDDAGRFVLLSRAVKKQHKCWFPVRVNAMPDGDAPALKVGDAPVDYAGVDPYAGFDALLDIVRHHTYASGKVAVISEPPEISAPAGMQAPGAPLVLAEFYVNGYPCDLRCCVAPGAGWEALAAGGEVSAGLRVRTCVTNPSSSNLQARGGQLAVIVLTKRDLRAINKKIMSDRGIASVSGEIIYGAR